MNFRAVTFYSYVLFAVAMIGGEIWMNYYGTMQTAMNRIDSDERAELRAFRDVELKERFKQTEEFVAPRLETISGMNRRNEQRLANNEPLSYVKIKAAEQAKVDSARVADRVWQESKEGLIVQKYAKQRSEINIGNTFSLAWVMPCLSLFIAFFSSWVQNPQHAFVKRHGLTAAYFAQIIASLITLNAIWNHQGNIVLAALFCAGATFCIPFCHSLASDLWKVINGEMPEKTITMVSPNDSKQIESHDITLTAEKSITTTNSITATIRNAKVSENEVRPEKEVHLSKFKSIDVWKELPKPQSIDQAKIFISLLVLTGKYENGDKAKVAEMVGIPETSLKRKYDEAKRTYRQKNHVVLKDTIQSLLQAFQDSVPSVTDSVPMALQPERDQNGSGTVP